MKVKYIRVSTTEQNTDRQLSVEYERNYIDKCSGSIPFNERPQAKKLLANDEITEVCVHSIDRLGRNTLDIMQTIQYFTSKGINVVSDKEALQTIVEGKENPIAKMLIGILGTLAEFELSRIKERQAEGIAKARQKGVYSGRPEGTKESKEAFLNKESTKAVIRHLKAGESLRRAAILSGTSIGTVQKVKRIIGL